MEQIRMVDLQNQYLRLKKDIDSAIQKVLNDAAFIKGPEVQQFEEEFAGYLNTSDVIGCGNGTDALQIALMALDLPPGSEIIVPSFNYVSAAEVITLMGYTPVFADVHPETFNLYVDELDGLITEKTKAIIAVHLFGQCCDMQPLLECARQNGLYVIEDTAQSTGAEYTFPDGSVKKAGSMGDIGTFSFFPSKNLGCMGDGGAIATNNSALAEKCRQIANHGQKEKFTFDFAGMNSRLDTIQAAILRVKLQHLGDFNERRQKAAKLYDSLLDNTEYLKLPSVGANRDHVYNQYSIQVLTDGRDDLKEFLSEKEIPTVVYYPRPLHYQKAYNDAPVRKPLLVSEKLCSHILSLPIHTEMTDEQISFISENVLVGLKGI